MAPHVLIIGGGFGGLTAAKSLKHAPVKVTLVDRCNHHLFAPLLYQVATSGLSTSEVATPIRSVLRKQENTRVLLDEVKDIDLENREVTLRDERPLSYEYLIVAAGAQTNYFGNLEWSSNSLGLKDLDDAIELRRRVLLAFEAAERTADDEARRKLLTFVVIGGGPTGVELAGALAELSRRTLARDFRVARPAEARIVLLEMLPRILPAFDESLAEKAARHLGELGVEVMTGEKVTSIDEDGVHVGGELLESGTVTWAAGVQARPLTARLGVALDRGGRVIVGDDCSIPGHPEAFVIGDMASFRGPEGKPLPGVAPVAMQQARSVAANIGRTLGGEARKPFSYRDKGVMATVGRSRAVLEMGRLRVDGFLAWLAWVFVHVFYLIGFRNRAFVLAEWAFSYFTYRKGARLITGRRIEAGKPARLVEPSEIDVERMQARRREEEERPPLH
ncbi:NAD(P)/FAD-dependent oxidoreductase [Vulgatibacter incomptus]|uniref:NADH:ubiquinone reductase (non-electrogenic) n=1 Tax=Vulgatibacter incomptus TaxID=1391653 RepID=A0A0K1PFJ0_9BACT|nr:NAD(P)/FAD-dependent oxidoreductase [Vulgatibacter incomptus]AKU92196.1 NADH dehydrogenase [Vulgatibacter incomptus]